MSKWQDFYEWLEYNRYHVYRGSNIFRESKFITSFDPQEDEDSGEIEKTMARIKELDPFNFK